MLEYAVFYLPLYNTKLQIKQMLCVKKYLIKILKVLRLQTNLFQYEKSFHSKRKGEMKVRNVFF